MGRGVASKGKKSGAEPDWLNPAEEPAGGQQVQEEKPRRRRDRDDELVDEPKGKKGIRVRCSQLVGTSASGLYAHCASCGALA
eukprot:3378660-Prymnesium_polylepis.1